MYPQPPPPLYSHTHTIPVSGQKTIEKAPITQHLGSYRVESPLRYRDSGYRIESPVRGSRLVQQVRVESPVVPVKRHLTQYVVEHQPPQLVVPTVSAIPGVQTVAYDPIPIIPARVQNVQQVYQGPYAQQGQQVGNQQYVGGNQQYVQGNQQFVGGNQQFVGGNQQYYGGNQQYAQGNQQFVQGNQQYPNSQFVGGSTQITGGQSNVQQQSIMNTQSKGNNQAMRNQQTIQKNALSEQNNVASKYNQMDNNVYLQDQNVVQGGKQSQVEANRYEEQQQYSNQRGYGRRQENDDYDDNLRHLEQSKRYGKKAYFDDQVDSRVRKPMDSEHEQKIQRLKNEKTKRELHVQDLEYKIHILEQENRSLITQMEQMKTDYKRLNQIYEEKYSHEIDRLQLENQDFEASNRIWAAKFKELELKCDDLVSEKQDFEEENRKLNDKILKIQVLLHEQPIKNQKFEATSVKY